MTRLLLNLMMLALPAVGEIETAEHYWGLVKRTDEAKQVSQIFETFGSSLGSSIFTKISGGPTTKGGGSIWTVPISRRIVTGDYLIEYWMLDKAENRPTRTPTLPISVTWYDSNLFPSSPWQRAVVDERKGKPVIVEEWKGVMIFQERIQWVILSACDQTAEEGKSPVKKGQLLGSAIEELREKSFPTVYRTDYGPDGMFVWKTIYDRQR